MHDWGVHLLTTLPRNSILVTQQDEIFGLWYLKYCEGYGETIVLLHYDALYTPYSWFWNTVENRALPAIIAGKQHPVQYQTGSVPPVNRILAAYPDSVFVSRYDHSQQNSYYQTPHYLAWRLTIRNENPPARFLP